MLTNELLNAVAAYCKNMQRSVTLVLQTGEHEKKQELYEFLAKLVEASDNLSLEQVDTQGTLSSPISFGLNVDGEYTGIQFSGIPGGHEFNSLILAILQSGGSELKIDDAIQSWLKNVDVDLNFEVFVSLSCHNCPEVVQAVNQFALINTKISSEMIDGGLFQEMVESRGIQGVPSVYLNGEPFATGKVEVGQLFAKLQDKFPDVGKKVTYQQLPTQDVTVIGGGPGGVAAAIYAARKGLKVTMIADRFGGQVKDTVDIENLISNKKTTGTELSGNMMAHLQDYDINLKENVRVDGIEKGDIKKLNLSSGQSFDSKTVIVATGAKWRELGVPGERENVGQGVAYCPHCDGPFFKGKDVVVVGGGNSGVEAAIDLAGMVNKVTLIEFMPNLKADQVLIDRASSTKNIEIINNAAVQSIDSDGKKVQGVTYTNRSDDEVNQIEVAGVFVQIGLQPNSEFVEGVVEKTQHGEIVIDERGRTSEPGIFACGDVTTVPYKQIVVAMGEGAKASLSAFDYLIRN